MPLKLSLPRFVAPMLAGASGPFDSDEHLFEVKWDGIRALAYVEGDGYRLLTQDVTLPKGPGTFVSAFRDMAAVLRGEKENDYPLSHELAVHETILRAGGYSVG